MKKHIFRFTALLCAALMGLEACSIDDPVAGPIIGGNEPDPGPGGKEYIIVPDGDFSDWEAIPASELVQSTVPDNAFFPTGKKVKVYAGATYINLYVEFEEDPQMPVQIMHLYIDKDNDQTTGYGNTAWTNDGSDILFEGYLVDKETGECITYDPTIFTYEGEPLAEEWDGWTEALAPGLGVCSNSEFVDLGNGHKAFEMTILRSAIPGLATIFRMGIALQYDWNDIAYLPAGSAVNINGTPGHGPVANLLIGAAQDSEPSNAQITIDGDFSDWEALDELDIFGFTAPEDAATHAAHKMMAAYNKDYLYIYLEYDGSADIGTLDLYMDADGAMDGNGLATTGFGGWNFSNDGSDLLFEASIGSFDPEVFQYTGEPMAGEWAWTTLLAPGSGVVTGSQATVLENGNTAVEISISRTIPGLGDKCLIGAVFQNSEWATVGWLPVSSAVDGQNVVAEKLAVDFTRRNGQEEQNPQPAETSIVIDGDLSDWDDVALHSTLPEDAAANYPAAKTMKAAADKDFIYLYLEYDNTLPADKLRLNVYMDTDMAFGTDGLATTGAGSWLFSNDGTEIYICGLLFDGSETTPGWSWAEVFMYSGTPLAAEWDWTQIVSSGSGATANSRAVDLGNGISAVEASILRAAIPGLGDQVKIGIYLQNDWSECGILPQGPAAEDSFQAAEKLTLDLP